MFTKILFCCFFNCLAITSCQESLRLLHIIFRHGDRTPTELIPSDKRGAAIWPNGLGQLTQLGIQQEYELGEFLRRRYGDFLNDTYVNDEIRVVSTDKERTLMSAYSLLAGLYPPQGFQKWGVEKNISVGQLWQPIPVRSLPYDTDPLLSTDVPCPLYDDMYTSILHSKEANDLRRHFKAVIDFCIEKAGYTTGNDLDNIFDLYGILEIMKLKGLEPDWSAENNDLIEELYGLALRGYRFMFNTLPMVQFKAGPFLNELLINLNNYISDKMSHKRKLMLYSSHDSVIGALMFALGIWNNQLPPYGTALIFELHEPVTGQYEVRTFLKNDTVNNAVNGKVISMDLGDGCEPEKCSIDAFRSLLSPLVLDNFEERCRKTKAPYSNKTVVVFVLVAGVLLVLVGVAIWYFRRKRQSRNFSYRSANFAGDDTEQTFG